MKSKRKSFRDSGLVGRWVASNQPFSHCSQLVLYSQVSLTEHWISQCVNMSQCVSIEMEWIRSSSHSGVLGSDLYLHFDVFVFLFLSPFALQRCALS